MNHWLGETGVMPESALECLTDYPELDDVLNRACEAYVYDLMTKDQSDADFYAMEGVTVDAARMAWDTIKETRAMRKEMNAAKKEGKMGEAAKKAKAIAKKFDELDKRIGKLDQSVSSAAIVNIALAVAALAAVAATSFGLSKLGGMAGTKAGTAIGNSDKVSNAVSKGVSAAVNPAKQYQAGKAIGKSKIGSFAYQHSETVRKGVSAYADHKAAKAGEAAAKALKANAATVGGKVGKVAGASLPGAIAGGTAIGAFLKKKGADKEKGKLQPNDVNALIAIIRSTCKKAKQDYLDMAASFEAAKEAWNYVSSGYEPASEGNLLDMLMGM